MNIPELVAQLQQVKFDSPVKVEISQVAEGTGQLHGRVYAVCSRKIGPDPLKAFIETINVDLANIAANWPAVKLYAMGIYEIRGGTWAISPVIYQPAEEILIARYCVVTKENENGND